MDEFAKTVRKYAPNKPIISVNGFWAQYFLSVRINITVKK